MRLRAGFGAKICPTDVPCELRMLETIPLESRLLDLLHEPPAPRFARMGHLESNGTGLGHEPEGRWCPHR